MEHSKNFTARDAGDELLRHAQWLKRLARGLVADPERADDLVQDAWVAALRNPPPAGRAMRPWLSTVVRNAAWQGFRGRARRGQRELEARAPQPLAGPEEVAERLETERQLTAELARLDEPFRSSLMLRYYDGLEPTEIARSLGIPASTVRSRIQCGLELLRERLDRRFGERGAWCALLLPFADGRELAIAGGAFGSVAVPGALVMNVLSKIGVSVAAVAALALTLGVLGVLPDSIWPLHSEPAVPLAVPPYAPMVEAEAPPSVAAVEPARAAGADAAPSAAGAVAPVLDSSLPVAVVEARVVDAAGAAFAGARLLDRDGSQSARSVGDGSVQLELAGRGERYNARFELSALGFASQGIEAVVTPGERVNLGTLVLQPGGVVSGRVVDADGRPLAGVRVSAGEADVPRRVLEEERLQSDTRGVPATETRSDGAFTLGGLPAGRVRIWASASGSLASYSAPIEVKAGEEAYGVELVLAPMPLENHILIAVVDPDGAPVPHARLEFRYSASSTGTTSAGELVADAAGRHEFVVAEDTLLALTAFDPEQRHDPASATDLRPGPRTNVLSLSAAAPLTLIVHDRDGAPVERFGFALLSPDGSFEHQSSARAARPDGRAEARVPGTDFVLRVDAPGFELAQSGPYSSGAVGDTIEIELAPVPGVRGRVLFKSEPVAGARVRLHPLVEPNVRYEKDGFVSFWQIEATDEVESDADGRFVLTVRSAGEYAARATKPGFAPAVSDTVHIGAGLSAPELELELTTGGAIEGRVIAARGDDAAGTIVGLSRGDGYDRTVRVGADGAYRFERLTPGAWCLSARAEEIVPRRTSTRISDAREPVELAWTCTVRAGETSYCDLRLVDADACVLLGRWSVDAAPPGPWQAWLAPVGGLFEHEPDVRIPLDPEGRFRLTAAEPGRYQLVLVNMLVGPEMQWVLDVVELRTGETTWERALETGTIVMAQAPVWDGEAAPAAVHFWQGEGELRALTVLAAVAPGELRVAVPAGAGRIVRPDLAEHDFTRWPTLLALEVPRGGKAPIRLP